MREHFIDKLEENLIGVLFIIACGIVIIQAMIKYAAPDYASVTSELSQYIFCYLSFLGLGYSMKYGADLSIDLFPKLTSGRLKPVFQTIYNVLYLLIYAALLFGAVQVVVQTGTARGEATGIPLVLIYFSAVVGFGVGLIRWLQKLLTNKKAK